MNSISKEWRKLLKKILKRGEFNDKDDSRVLEILGYNTFVENPLIAVQKTMGYSSSHFLDAIKKGWLNVDGYMMNSQGILEYVEGMHDIDIIDCFKKEDGFVYTYPERLKAMRVWDKDTKRYDVVNQLNVIIDRLTENPGTNRAVAHFYNCGLDRNEVDIPCLQFLQATIRGNALTLHVIFRSNDIYGAWPANMFLITYIGLLICDELKDKYPLLYFKGIDYHVTSAHIYETDWEMAKKIEV